MLDGHLRSLEVCFLSDSLFFSLSLFDQSGKSQGVDGTHNQRGGGAQKQTNKKTRAGVGK